MSISTQEKKDFVRTWLLLIRSGKPINESFDILARQTNSKPLAKVLMKARIRTEKGTPIYQVFEDDPSFDKAFSSFIRAGEESGTLTSNLNHLVEWLERKHKLEMELSAATLYPKIILTFALVLGSGLTYFVLPRLTPIFSALDVDLPLMSRILLDISEFIQNHGITLLLGVLGFLIFMFLLSKVEFVKEKYDHFIIRVPFIGDFIRDYQLTIISQLITTLFGSGLMVTDIIDITTDSVSSSAYRDSLIRIKQRVVQGDSLSLAMEEYPALYPGVFVSIITTGEETGAYVDSFKYLSDFYSSSISERSSKIPVVIEPVILIFIGLFVAFIASAVILPIYQVTEGLY